MKRQLPLLLLILTFFGWLFLNADIYLDPETILPMDNIRSNLASFQYIANTIKHLGTFPEWVFSEFGGTWVAPYESILVILLPYRWLGYGWGAHSSLPLSLIYKLCFVVLGQGTFLLGCYFLAEKLFSCRWKALGAALLVLFSGLLMGTLHQEQGFATVMFIPWMWFLFLTLRSKPLRFVLLAWLLGFSGNLYYPHFIAYYLMVLAVAFVWHLLKLKNYAMAVWKSYAWPKTTMIFASIAFALAVMPAVHAYTNYFEKVGSPIRQRESELKPKTYEEFVSMQSKLCNVLPKNFLTVFGLKKGIESLETHDQRALYAPPLSLFFIIGGLFLGISFFASQLVALGLFACFAIGFYGFLPKLLWHFMPGVEVFRQWYHFIHFFNLHLLFACAFVVWAIGERIRKPAVGGVLISALIISGVVWSVEKLDEYRRTLFHHGWETVAKNDGAFIQNTFYESRDQFEHSIPSFKPKGLSLAKVQELNLMGPLHWVTHQGLIPAWDVRIGVWNDAFHAPLTEIRGPLVFGQYNDGNWRVTDENERPISVRSGLHSLLEMEVPPGTKMLTITRTSSWWPIWVALLWVPPVGVFALWATRLRFRNAPVLYPQPT